MLLIRSISAFSRCEFDKPFGDTAGGCIASPEQVEVEHGEGMEIDGG